MSLHSSYAEQNSDNVSYALYVQLSWLENRLIFDKVKVFNKKCVILGHPVQFQRNQE